MSDYSNIVGSAEVADAMMPDQIIKDIIKETPKSSVLLTRARKATLSKKKAKQPVLSTLPEAYWVSGETGLKKTSKSDWKNLYITAEELAVIVPVPDALIDDADVPLWEEIKPLLAEAIGKKVDAAGLFGIDTPDSWPDAVVPAAIAAGNVITRGTGADLGADVAMLGKMLASQGYAMNGFASKPGLQWELIGLRNDQGSPIYTQNLSGTPESGLYGRPLDEVDNGAWVDEAADLIGADWKKFVIGIRQDITYDLFKEGVISDDEGKVVLNLMQQDCKALRVVFRVGFQVAAPKTRLNGKYPAGVIAPEQDEEKAPSGEFDPQGDTPPTEAQTNAQIQAWAQAHDIDLGSATTKAEMLAKIAEALDDGQ